MKHKLKGRGALIKTGQVSQRRNFSFKLNEKIAEEEGSDNMKKAGNSDRESNEEGSTADREETAEEKRVRIAKEYLRTMQKLADDSSENDTKLAGRLTTNHGQILPKYR